MTGPKTAAQTAPRNALAGLHVVTGARGGAEQLHAVSCALDAGAGVVQVRVKGATDREVHDFAARVAELCREHDALCIVNDRVDIALAVGAAGTHLGADDMPMASARAVAGPAHLLGGTARTPDTARRLVAEGADYLGVGPAYETTTKAGLPAPLGAVRVGVLAAAVDVPVIAIGGVTPGRVPELVAAGAAGVAVVSAIAAAADPAAATRSFLEALAAGRCRR